MPHSMHCEAHRVYTLLGHEKGHGLSQCGAGGRLQARSPALPTRRGERTAQHLVLIVAQVADGVAGVAGQRAHRLAAHAHLQVRDCARSSVRCSPAPLSEPSWHCAHEETTSDHESGITKNCAVNAPTLIYDVVQVHESFHHPHAHGMGSGTS
jgi:hypothetical protein